LSGIEKQKKESIVRSRLLLISITVGLLFVASLPLPGQGGPGNRNGGPGTGQCAACGPTSGAAQVLNTDEIYWLSFMREEEKLARDVYLELYRTHKLNIFRNIAQSEQRHFDAIGLLLERYGVPDPAASAPGVFNDPDLQQMYDKLILSGKESLLAALKAGVEIEEHDIKDLNLALATEKADIDRVYSNLLSGSFNHLDAFNSHLEVAGANQ
jgi:hypothetical protein